MPKRTNPFQQLIYLIQNQFSENAVVTESKFMIDKVTGSPVEVDIAVESEIGGIPLVVGFECTATSRPSTIGWVREMAGKHKDLSTDKVVLVSKSGFSKNALKKAKFENLETITLEEAEKISWTSYFNELQNLGLLFVDYKPIGHNITYEVAKSVKSEVVFESNPKIIQKQEKKTIKTTLNDWKITALRDNKVFAEIFKQWKKHPQRNQKDSFDIILTSSPPETTIEDEEGNLHKILKFELKARANIRSTPVSLTPCKYLNTEVAHGRAKNIIDQNENVDQELTITFIKQEGKPPKGALMLPAKKGKTRVLSMNFFEKEDSDKGE